jgi:hypothetical protein
MSQKVILNIVTSLDGYVANSDDSIDWLEPYDNLSEYGFDDFISSVGAIIMGNLHMILVSRMIGLRVVLTAHRQYL